MEQQEGIGAGQSPFHEVYNNENKGHGHFVSVNSCGTLLSISSEGTSDLNLHEDLVKEDLLVYDPSSQMVKSELHRVSLFINRRERP